MSSGSESGCSTSALPKVPPELLDCIVDSFDLHVAADKQALLALGLVCRRTLWRSRQRLFSTLVLECNGTHFGRFLSIVDSIAPSLVAPLIHSEPESETYGWITFSSIRRLHLTGVIPDFIYSLDEWISPLHILWSRLQNITSLCLAEMSWASIGSPSPTAREIRELLFGLPRLEEVTLVNVMFRIDMVHDFFVTLPPTVKKLTMHHLMSVGMPTFEEEAVVVRREMKWGLIDSTSVLFLADTIGPVMQHSESEWGLASTRSGQHRLVKPVQFEVDSFHLRLCDPLRGPWIPEKHLPFLKRFVNDCGPSMERIYVEIPRYERFEGKKSV
jgi:hypothetical protein